ncbi:hypothetical protein RRG08_019224 [Elysia crispata]|uniref:Uncharacterized protein n=1 Tax=Elysia crispata TaxID=231223 RepID=A0AAE1E479_9GAST|nr:hypothetical protein RRG08_019224 [Elysia crispata]
MYFTDLTQTEQKTLRPVLRTRPTVAFVPNHLLDKYSADLPLANCSSPNGGPGYCPAPKWIKADQIKQSPAWSAFHLPGHLLAQSPGVSYLPCSILHYFSLEVFVACTSSYFRFELCSSRLHHTGFCAKLTRNVPWDVDLSGSGATQAADYHRSLRSNKTCEIVRFSWLSSLTVKRVVQPLTPHTLVLWQVGEGEPDSRIINTG